MFILPVLQSCGWSRDGRCLLVALRNKNTLYPYVFTGSPPSIGTQPARQIITCYQLGTNVVAGCCCSRGYRCTNQFARDRVL